MRCYSVRDEWFRSYELFILTSELFSILNFMEMEYERLILNWKRANWFVRDVPVLCKKKLSYVDLVRLRRKEEKSVSDMSLCRKIWYF